MKERGRLEDSGSLVSKLRIHPIDDPVPRSTLGGVNAYVEVEWPEDAEEETLLLAISYSTGDLGWVNQNSLRVFEIDVAANSFKLVSQSWVDTDDEKVYARITKGGTYGAIGRPVDAKIELAIDVFAKFHDKLQEEKTAGVDELHRNICHYILCSPEVMGPFGEGLCDRCVGLDIPAGGLPEIPILVPEFEVDPSMPRPCWCFPPQTPCGNKYRPWGIALNPNTNRVYASCWDPLPSAGPRAAGKLQVMDATTMQCLTLIDMGRVPAGVAVDTQRNLVYVTDYEDHTVTVVDGASNAVADVFPVGPRPWSLAVDSNTGWLFVCEEYYGDLRVIDPNGYVGLATHHLGMYVASGVADVAINPTLGKYYAVQGNGLYSFDLATFAMTGQIPIPSVGLNVAIDQSSGLVYLPSLVVPRELIGHDGTNLVPKTRIPLIAQATHRDSLAIDPANHKAYLVDHFSNGVQTIDLGAGSVIGAVNVPKPYSVATGDGVGACFVTADGPGLVVKI